MSHVLLLIFIKIAGEGNMTVKKKIFDKVMLLRRFKEEKVIVLGQIKLHCQYLASMMDIMKDLGGKEMNEGPCSFYMFF